MLKTVVCWCVPHLSLLIVLFLREKFVELTKNSLCLCGCICVDVSVWMWVSVGMGVGMCVVRTPPSKSGVQTSTHKFFVCVCVLCLCPSVCTTKAGFRQAHTRFLCVCVCVFDQDINPSQLGFEFQWKTTHIHWVDLGGDGGNWTHPQEGRVQSPSQYGLPSWSYHLTSPPPMLVWRTYAQYRTRTATLSQVRKTKKSVTRRLKTTTLSTRAAVYNERDRSSRKVFKHNRHIHSTECTTKRWLERRMG